MYDQGKKSAFIIYGSGGDLNTILNHAFHGREKGGEVDWGWRL
jgi:hypothetical protein